MRSMKMLIVDHYCQLQIHDGDLPWSIPEHGKLLSFCREGVNFIRHQAHCEFDWPKGCERLRKQKIAQGWGCKIGITRAEGRSLRPPLAHTDYS